MNNEQLNHFSRSPVDLDIGRSVFHRPKRRLTTLNSSQLIPLMAEEVLPGDSVKVKVSSLIRMATPLHPVMDNAVADIHFYFCPNRQVWEHWKEFMGENTSSYWAPSVSYTIPQISCPTAGADNVQGSSVKGFAKGSIGDYLGLPIKRDFGTVSHLPFRHYVNIWNNYYRDQNTMSPANFSTGDSTVTGSNVGDYWAAGGSRIGSYEYYVNNGGYVTYAQTGGAPLPVCRLHDRFSSCLPSPQKGPSVLMPLGTTAPVTQISPSDTSSVPFSPVLYDASGVGPLPGIWGSKDAFGVDGTYTDGSTVSSGTKGFINLAADLSNATAASVNSLRNAFMLQRYYEKLARGGSRYFEMIRAFFGVVVPDLTVQIPEFLGGRRFPINMTQVAQTSSTDAVSPQGNLSAYSLTTDVSDDVFTKSFTEHGYLIAVCCIRTEHSYSQGIPRHFSRKSFTDFYVPTFANAPEQPIYNRELYVKGDSTDAGVFGYQEAWSEYRYAQPEITGEFRPDYAQSLDSYHYGDDYSDTPVLSAGWIAEPLRNLNRTLAVTNHDQFLCDFVFDMTWVRVMPVYSVPGLLDHH